MDKEDEEYAKYYSLGTSFIFNDFSNIKYNLNSIKQRINDQYLQLQNAEIHESQQLRFFQEIYNMGQRPHYVNTLKNRNDRAVICKICTSAHSLMIERGRYFNINKNERHCPICKTRQVEDENHFILKCKRFEQIRLKFYDKVSKTLNLIFFNNAENKMNILLNNKSYPILKLTSSFISNCLAIRKSLLL